MTLHFLSRAGLLGLALLVARPCAAEADFAQRFTDALGRLPVPGLRTLTIGGPDEAWVFELESRGGGWTCWVDDAHQGCSRGATGAGLVALLAAFREQVGPAAPGRVEVTPLEVPGVEGYLVRTRTRRAETLRPVVALPEAGLAVFPDVAGLGVPAPHPLVQMSIEPWSDEPQPQRWMLVMLDAHEGNGNNASGSETYVGVVAGPDADGRWKALGRVELGGASWWRSIWAVGKKQGSSHTVYCPSYGAQGLLLTLSCPVDADPRSRPPPLSERCRRVCDDQAKHATQEWPRLKRYALDGERLVPQRSAQVVPLAKAKPGALAITERLLGNQAGYLELTNRSDAAIDLSGATVRSFRMEEDAPGQRRHDTGDSRELYAAVIDAGETMLFTLDSLDGWEAGLAAMATGPGAMRRSEVFFSPPYANDALELVWQDKPVASAPAPELPTPPEAESAPVPMAWQRDARGRTCVRPASPGQPNPACPK